MYIVSPRTIVGAGSALLPAIAAPVVLLAHALWSPGTPVLRGMASRARYVARTGDGGIARIGPSDQPMLSAGQARGRRDGHCLETRQ